MEVSKVRELKEVLEDEILDLVVQFEKETGTRVTLVKVLSSAPDYGNKVEIIECVVEI